MRSATRSTFSILFSGESGSLAPFGMFRDVGCWPPSRADRPGAGARKQTFMWPVAGRDEAEELDAEIALDRELALDCKALLLDIGRSTHAVEHDVGTGACKSTRAR